MEELSRIHSKKKLNELISKEFGLDKEETNTLADFLINLSFENPSIEEFSQKINELQEENIFIETIQEIFCICQKIKPSPNLVIKKDTNGKTNLTSNDDFKNISCLSLPNFPQKNMEELLLDFDEVDYTNNNNKIILEKDKVKSDYDTSQINNKNRSRETSQDNKFKDKKLKISDVIIGNDYNGVIVKMFSNYCNIAFNNSHYLEGFFKFQNNKKSEFPIHKIKQGTNVKMRVLQIVNNKIYVNIFEIYDVKNNLLWKESKQSNEYLINEQEENLKDSSFYTKETYSKYNYQKSDIGEITGIKLDNDDENKPYNDVDIQNSPDLWELKQLNNAKFVKFDTNDYLYKLSKNTEIEKYKETESGIEVEISEKLPKFLKGQNIDLINDLNKKEFIESDNDGFLQKSAINQLELAKVRREMKEQKHKNILESIPKDILVSKYETYMNKDIKYDEIDIKTEEDIKKLSYRKNENLREKKENLPIFQLKNELLEEIEKRNVLIVIGETGSGKTTQMTQYLLEKGYCKNGKIGCTQPRRVAAISIAKRVAEEMNCKLGEEVGYSIRFEDCCSEKTLIKYMTDGMLLREALLDKNLSSYSVIILDEAHERTIHTDILFGLLKQALSVRKDLKLIVTSATLEAERFSKFFDNCGIFRIPGRMFDVEIFYSNQHESDYLDAALLTVMQIHLSEPKGDILLFLTGQEEIDTACELLNNRMKSLGNDAPPLLVLPVYSSLPNENQSLIFDPAPEGTRKCVVATNIAEASLTIDGIYYVVDPGFSKIKIYNPKSGMDSLIVKPISKSSAIQRSGRAGRTGPGKCYRLYTKDSYLNEMRQTSIPEIQRTNLSNTVLLLKAMGINDLLNFDFMDPPPKPNLLAAMAQLFYLGALDDDGLLTKLGRRMAEFPLEPNLAKMVLTSVDFSCSDEIIIIVSMLSVNGVFHRPKEKAQLADNKKNKFYSSDGDHIRLLKVYKMWELNKYSDNWCFDNFILSRSMKKAKDIRKQLNIIMSRFKLPVISCGNSVNPIKKSITSGFFFNCSKRVKQGEYETLNDGLQVYIHPSSVFFGKNPKCVIYHELIFTSKEFMKEVINVDPKWLLDVAPNFFKKCDPENLSIRKKQEKLEPLHTRGKENYSWRLSLRKGLM